MDRILTMFEIKSFDEKTGEFKGYGSTFGNIDDGNDVVEKGAFDETIKEHRSDGTMPNMYWCHDSKEPIGEWHEWKQDGDGLLMEGQLWVGEGIPKAQQAHRLFKSKGTKGLSIGYHVKEGGKRTDHKSGVRYLSKLGVSEVSPTPRPMNTKAKIVSVKSTDLVTNLCFKNEDGSLKSIREIETLLRDGGLSETEAKKLLAGGYSKINPRDVEAEELLELVKTYTNPA